MHSLDCDEMDILWPNDSIILTFYHISFHRKCKWTSFVKEVLPITPSILKKMFSHLNMNNMQDRALWCSYLLSFYGLLRKSNAVPKSKKFEVGKVLVRRNVMIDTSANMVYLYLGYGKTNNFCTRDIIIPIPGNSDPALDPVRHLQTLFSSVNVNQDAPAFSFGPSSFITYSSFTSRLKSLLRKAGYDPDLYSGHSFKRGGATFLHSCGGTALMIQASGDWSSQCFTRYLYLTESDRLHSQRLMSSAINSMVTDVPWPRQVIYTPARNTSPARSTQAMYSLGFGTWIFPCQANKHPKWILVCFALTGP